MIVVLLAGAVVGLGVLLLVLVVAPPRTQPASALARLDVRRAEVRERAQTVAADPGRASDAAWKRTLGRSTADALSRVGVELGQLRSDLAVVGRTLEAHLATSVLSAVAGFFVPIVLASVAAVVGGSVSFAAPLALSLLAALVGAWLPSLMVRGQASARRRDFRHVVGSFLDLVAMSLAGGRGVPEALQSASELSDSWGMVRIRNALGSARLHGRTPWSALGLLGEELRIDELRDLAAALALVAEDGAKVRDSLAARAGSLRRRELAESEGKAGESSQSMLVAQLLLCVGFLVFLLYPAMTNVFTSG
ncbi:type II secretion system F family protein [Cellulomonas edaphi]|uniref:Type II secretion system F family protein n=1 Tax=Cellulomonas edaphi TaxID=3053468 RepID=A0ABT7S6L1_9CELL|nr:type II secretion system F family protein [Cellulomons edaphi]MDM7831256.1 type II secretion system F family protein [Cellulomons edaphi]